MLAHLSPSLPFPAKTAAATIFISGPAGITSCEFLSFSSLRGRKPRGGNIRRLHRIKARLYNLQSFLATMEEYIGETLRMEYPERLMLTYKPEDDVEPAEDTNSSVDEAKPEPMDDFNVSNDDPAPAPLPPPPTFNSQDPLMIYWVVGWWIGLAHAFSHFMGQLYDRITNLLRSNNVADNLGAPRATDELIDLRLGDSGTKNDASSVHMLDSLVYSMLDMEFVDYDMESIRRGIIETMAEPVLEEYIIVTRNYISGNDRGKIIEKSFLELKGTFLVTIRDNVFSGTNGEDVVKHIEKFLEVAIPLKIPNVSDDQFRLSVFPISLTDATSEWFKEECIGSITSLEDLTEKIYGKFYLPSRTNKEMEAGEDEVSWDQTDNEFENCPLCKAFDEFNYLFQIDPDVLTKDIPGFKTYEEYKDDWIYEWKELGLVSDIDKRTKNEAKLDKTEHESGKSEKVNVKSQQKVKPYKVKADQEKLNQKIQL
ncbi:hypothetical protein Tco_0525882 [Tanacetum coccineum]